MTALLSPPVMPGSMLTVKDTAGPQLQFDSLLWPAGIDWPEGQIELLSEISKGDANALLRAWTHPLGAWSRPFGAQYFGLAVDGEAVAVAVSGSTVGKTSAGYQRRQVVELGRIARAPQHPGVMRVMLRLWRDYLAQRWARDYWPVHAAVSYALPGKAGNLYRFDGWEFVGHCKPWTYNGGYSNPSRVASIGDGRKRLYRYAYPSSGQQAA